MLSINAVGVVQLFSVISMQDACVSVVYLHSSSYGTSAIGIPVLCFYCCVHFLTQKSYLFVSSPFKTQLSTIKCLMSCMQLYGIVAIVFACDITGYHCYFVIFYYAIMNQSMYIAFYYGHIELLHE